MPTCAWTGALAVPAGTVMVRETLALNTVGDCTLKIDPTGRTASIADCPVDNNVSCTVGKRKRK